jgi:hypothetical protein
MLSDPITVKYATVDKTHPRVDTGNGLGVFHWENGTDNQDVITKQTKSKGRKRREIRLTRNKDYTNPSTGLTTPVSASVYLVIDEPNAGFDRDNLTDMVISLSGFLTASTAAVTKQILAGEY